VNEGVPMLRNPLLLTVLAALVATPAAAQDPDWLDEEPTGITGPGVVAPGEVQVTLGGGVEMARRGRARDTWGSGVQLQAGIGRGFDVSVGQGVGYGRAGGRLDEAEAPAWAGASQFALRWAIAEQDGWRPAFGLLGAATIDYGRYRPSQALEAQALFATVLSEAPRPVTAYLNLGWTALVDPEPGERPGAYSLAAALGQAVRPDTALGITWTRAQQDRGEPDQTLVLASVQHRLAERTILVAAIGTGVGRDAPALVLGVSLTWSFGAR
jgi:hypothetical protein